MLIYLGVEGVTYDIVDGKPVLKEDVSKILNSDRENISSNCASFDARRSFGSVSLQSLVHFSSIAAISGLGVLAGVLFYVMEQNAVQENMDYMEYTMQRNEDGSIGIENIICVIKIPADIFILLGPLLFFHTGCIV